MVERRIVNFAPKPGDVYAELLLAKPVRGYIWYAADEIFLRRDSVKTGIAWIDSSAIPRPVYEYKLRPDREVPQGNVERKFQEKSPCCKRTLIYVTASGRERKYCRSCDKEVA